MKIAYLVASSDISGGQRVIFQQAEALAGLECDVTLVCPEPAPEWFPVNKATWEMAPFHRSKALINADIRVATFWTTVAPAVTGFRGPVFHLCQGYEADFSFYASKRTEIESAYAEATHKLAVSPHIARRLRTAGYAPVTHIGQTFDSKEFPPNPTRRFDLSAPTILLVGVFEADVKGIREALEALAVLRRLGLPFRLHRVSTWPQSVEEKSIFIPDAYQYRLTPSEMGEVYRGSDLFIGPSHVEEGFGLPVLEALSSGLPAVLSDTPANRHIARTAAEYYPVGSTPALCLTLSRLLPDSRRRAKLSATGPLEAARFRTGDVADRLLIVFREAVQHRH